MGGNQMKMRIRGVVTILVMLIILFSSGYYVCATNTYTYLLEQQISTLQDSNESLRSNQEELIEEVNTLQIELADAQVE